MPSPSAPIRLYGGKLSGHSHRVELFLNLLGLPYEFVAVPPEARRTPEFLAMNAFGQIPVIDDNGTIIADSNAILVYLAKRYDAGGTWLPEEPVALAAVQRWLSAAAGPLAFGPAMARIVTVFTLPPDVTATLTAAKPLFFAMADRLLTVMEERLSTHAFLAADHATLADIAIHAYTRAAPEGGIDLSGRPHVRAWLERVEALPKFVAMPAAAAA